MALKQVEKFYFIGIYLRAFLVNVNQEERFEHKQFIKCLFHVLRVNVLECIYIKDFLLNSAMAYRKLAV